MLLLKVTTGMGRSNRRRAMQASDEYRVEALRLCRRATGISDPDMKVEYESLAFAYMCLAQQADCELAEWAECCDLVGSQSRQS
jgi:hypothetical protein